MLRTVCIIGALVALSVRAEDAKCCEWANKGDCKSNAYYMKISCASACGTPGCTVDKAGEETGSCMTKVSPTCASSTGAMPASSSGSEPSGVIGAPTLPAGISMPGTPGGTPGTPGTSSGTPAAGSCSNTAGDTDCCAWAAKGECANNAFFMKVQCSKACGTCGCTVQNAGMTTAPCAVTVDPTCGSAASTASPTTGATSGTTAGTASTTASTASATESTASTASTTSGATTAAADATTAATDATTAATGATTAAPTGACTDNDQYCAFWASVNECSKNPSYMLQSCKKSCSQCGGTGTGSPSIPSTPDASGCTDSEPDMNLNKYCPFWASKGECTKNPSYMTSRCAKSCGSC